MPCLVFILSSGNAIRPLHSITNHYQYDGATEMILLAERSLRSDDVSEVMVDSNCGCTLGDLFVVFCFVLIWIMIMERMMMPTMKFK